MNASIDEIFQQTSARVLADSLEVYTVLLDNAGVIQKANAFARQISGGDILGKPFKEMVVGFHREFDLEQFVSVRGPRQALSLVSRGGVPKTFYFTWARQGDFTLLAGESSGEDTDMLRKSLLETNTELSNMTRQYQKTNAQLTKINEQKNTFLGIAAHDLRSPLASIQAYCDFLLEETDMDEEEKIDFIENIKLLSRHMLDLLEDLLDITRIETGKLSLELEKVRLPELVRKNLHLNRAIAERKRIDIRLCCNEDLPDIIIDPMKIGQVVNNIVSNAIKYSNSGTHIDVGIFRSGDYAAVSVQDEGIGIPSKDLDKIFQPFAKLKQKGTAGETSTGLGLAIVQKIITGHKGRVWVESEEGKGTAVYFTLPLPLQSGEEA